MKSQIINTVRIQLAAKSVNEAFARSILSSFIAPLDPEISELTDLRTVISEAVTNAIVHAYEGCGGTIYINMSYDSNRCIKITVRDRGRGIEDIETAMKPLYTTDKSGERGGMGFAIMKSFTDKLRVSSKPGKGTTVTMVRKLSEITTRGNELVQ